MNLALAAAYIAVAASVMMLGISAVSHISDTRRVIEAIRLHQVVPQRAVPAAAATLITAEFVAFGILIVDTHRIVTGTPPGWLLVPLGVSAGLAVYAATASSVSARYSTTAPCGCGGPAEAPLGFWTTLRAVALVALVGVAASVSSLEQLPVVGFDTLVLLLLVAGGLLGGHIWLLPASLAIPQGSAR